MNKTNQCDVCKGDKVVTLWATRENELDSLKTVLAHEIPHPLPEGARIVDAWCNDCGIKYHEGSV